MNGLGLLVLLAGFTVLASGLLIYPLRHHLVAVVLLLPMIFIGAFTGYYYWGDFAEWQQDVQHLDTQMQAQEWLKSIKNPQELIEKLRSKLDNTPKSAQGWYLLGRLYISQKDIQHSVTAFAKACQLNPDDEQYAVNYAHSLWLLNNQQMTEQIREIFLRLLKNNPNQPDALAMLAMDAFASHAYADAIVYWRRLLKLAPPQSEEAQAIIKAIVKAEAKEYKNQ